MMASHKILFPIALAISLILGCATKPEPTTPVSAITDKPSDSIPVAEFTPPQDGSYYPRPKYPREMFNQHQDGEVQLDVTVDENGTPQKIIVVESTNAHFTAAALEAIHTWKFAPKIEDGKPVRQRYLVPFIFKVR